MRAFAALSIVLLVAACGSESGSTGAESAAGPDDAVRQLLTALEAGSCSGVKDVVLTPATVDCEMVGTMEGSLASEGVAVEDVTYAIGDIVDESGTVATGWGDGDESSTWQVERIDGTWKVVFDSVE